MNLNMIQAKNETDDLLLSITKTCETLIRNIQTNAQETLALKITKYCVLIHLSTLRNLG